MLSSERRVWSGGEGGLDLEEASKKRMVEVLRQLSNSANMTRTAMSLTVMKSVMGSEESEVNREARCWLSTMSADTV